jgi:hypothetical protein
MSTRTRSLSRRGLLKRGALAASAGAALLAPSAVSTLAPQAPAVITRLMRRRSNNTLSWQPAVRDYANRSCDVCGCHRTPGDDIPRRVIRASSPRLATLFLAAWMGAWLRSMG